MTTQSASELTLIRCTAGSVSVGIDPSFMVGMEDGTACITQPEAAAPGLFRNDAGDWSVYSFVHMFPTAPCQLDGAGQLLLIETPRGRFGLLIDRFDELNPISDEQLLPVPDCFDTDTARWVTGVALVDSQPLLILDLERLARLDDLTDDGSHLIPPARKKQTAAPRSATATTTGDRLVALAARDYPKPGGRSAAIVLPINRVVEIIDTKAWTLIPAGPEQYRGLLAWRQQVIPLMDPSAWVGLGYTPLESSRVVIAKLGGTTVGLLAGPAVSILSPNTASVPTRHLMALTHSHILSIHDTTEQSLIFPNWRGFIPTTDTV